MVSPDLPGSSHAAWVRSDRARASGFSSTPTANGPMPQILYFNGRRVAMGDDLEPMVLFDQATTGRQGDGGREAAAHGGHEELSRRDAEDRVPREQAQSGGFAEEFLSAALLVPSLAPGDAGKMATLNDAIHAVDLAALDAHDQDEVRSPA